MVIKKLIAHRGNINGVNLDKENSQPYIEDSINKGFDCEIDIWLVNKKIFLGHDFPQIETSNSFLSSFKNSLWIHCKNLDALNYFLSLDEKFNFFWHEKDKFTLTSLGYIWTYPNNLVNEWSVIVDNSSKTTNYNCYGVCSDYIYRYE